MMGKYYIGEIDQSSIPLALSYRPPETSEAYTAYTSGSEPTQDTKVSGAIHDVGHGFHSLQVKKNMLVWFYVGQPIKMFWSITLCNVRYDHAFAS
ncbi:hypothetical protein R6Q59_034375 [Mikania micrantha]